MAKFSNKRFIHHLADWLLSCEWNHSTLFTQAWQVIKDPPSNLDRVISAILRRFKQKPTHEALCAFLITSPLTEPWFFTPERLSLSEICLSNPTPPPLLNADLPRLHTVASLCEWLAIEDSQLTWWCDSYRKSANTAPSLRHYHYTCLEKKSGHVRFIESPKRTLKAMQRQIDQTILRYAPVHAAAHGFQSQHSILQHAQLHTAKRRLFNFDLKHAFQSIRWAQVYNVFLRLGYLPFIARKLAHLCTHQCAKDDLAFFDSDQELANRLIVRHLPQGAPTSPRLSNCVMLHLDKRLTGLAKHLDATYSRYADDLAFSCDNDVSLRYLENLVGAICLEEGFALNHHKSRLRLPHQRQKVTGVVVNAAPNIDRRYYDQLKATLTNCIRHGASAQNREGHTDFKAHLRGKVHHVMHLSPARGEKLLTLFERILF